mmetsp:Transcript_8662/g.18300  ORF Transcript_8662/g.18300 Transcript_8662/m.18300 type:complete len:438 (+) Transcript_8662:477-1790(+)
MEMEDGRPLHDRGPEHQDPRANDQGGQGHTGRAEGTLGGGPHRPTLRPVPRGGTDHVPPDRRILGRPALPVHIHLFGHQRSASRRDTRSAPRDSTLRLRRRPHPQVPRRDRSSPLRRRLGPPPPLPLRSARQGSKDRGAPHRRQGLEHRRDRRLRRPGGPGPRQPGGGEGRDLLRQVGRIQPQHVQHAVASRGRGIDQEANGSPERNEGANDRGGEGGGGAAGVRTRLRASSFLFRAARTRGSIRRRRSGDGTQDLEHLDRLRRVRSPRREARRGPDVPIRSHGLRGPHSRVGAVRERGGGVRSHRYAPQEEGEEAFVHQVRRGRGADARRERGGHSRGGKGQTQGTHGGTQEADRGGRRLQPDSGTEGRGEGDRGRELDVPGIDGHVRVTVMNDPGTERWWWWGEGNEPRFGERATCPRCLLSLPPWNSRWPWWVW